MSRTWFAGGLLCMAAIALPCGSKAQGTGVGTVVGELTGQGVGTSIRSKPVGVRYETTTVQVLQDGTRLSTTSHSSFYRDSLGRTRHEVELSFPKGADGPRTAVSVLDPAARRTLHWNTGMHSTEYSAIDLPLPSASQPEQRRSRRAANLPPTAQRPASSSTERPSTNREDLGTDAVLGFSCQAERITTTFPVDYMGNDQPIKTVHEICRSVQFGLPLRTVLNDPRRGIITTVAVEVMPGEPDPALFEPPPGYTERPNRQ